MEIAVILIALATLIVAIPPAITAVRDLGWIAARRRAIASPQGSPQSSESSADADRVLVTLKPERAGAPGTLEHDLITFENRLPASYQSEDPLNGLNTLIRNPGMIGWMANSKAEASKWFIVVFVSLAVAMAVIIPYSLTMAGAIAAYLIFLVPVIAFLTFSYVERRKDQAAVEIVDEYLAYLRANQIEIGTELTQSRAAFNKGAASVAA